MLNPHSTNLPCDSLSLVSFTQNKEIGQKPINVQFLYFISAATVLLRPESPPTSFTTDCVSVCLCLSCLSSALSIFHPVSLLSCLILILVLVFIVLTEQVIGNHPSSVGQEQTNGSLPPAALYWCTHAQAWLDLVPSNTHERAEPQCVCVRQCRPACGFILV